MKEVKLANDRGFTLVDDEDFELVSKYVWYGSEGRVKGRVDGSNLVFLHRFIMQPEKHQQIDHINRNALDNRRSNLRIANSSQNGANRGKQINNTHKYKGVYFHKKTQTWCARIKLNKKHISLKYHATEEEAAKAYDDAARKCFGEFACTNF